jgi:hypothetical protein
LDVLTFWLAILWIALILHFGDPLFAGIVCGKLYDSRLLRRCMEMKNPGKTLMMSAGLGAVAFLVTGSLFVATAQVLGGVLGYLAGRRQRSK